MTKLFGGLLIAIGIFIAGASGLCSLTVLVGGGLGSPTSIFPAVLLFGGTAFALGVGAIIGGRALIKSASEESDNAPDS